MPQTISQWGANFIKRRESVVYVPYKDTNGNWTCGIGHLMGREPLDGEEWTHDEADMHFEADIMTASSCVFRVAREVIGLISPPMFDAMGSLAFNIGIGNFFKSSVAKAVHARAWQDAADAFLLWKDHGNALERREAERSIFLYGAPL